MAMFLCLLVGLVLSCASEVMPLEFCVSLALQDDIPVLTDAARAERAEREARWAAMRDGVAADEGVVLYTQVRGSGGPLGWWSHFQAEQVHPG